MEITSIFTPDLVALMFAAVIAFAVEHLMLAGLAEHYPWARLSKVQSYCLGLATLFGLFFIHAALNDRLEAWAAFAVITLAGGLTVVVLWVVNPTATRLEQPKGVDLTNSQYSHTHVVAMMENLAAFVARIELNSEDSKEASDMMRSYFRVMRANPEIDPDIPIAVIRKWLAQEVGEQE